MKALLGILAVIGVFIAVDWANLNGYHALVVFCLATVTVIVIIEGIVNAINKNK